MKRYSKHVDAKSVNYIEIEDVIDGVHVTAVYTVDRLNRVKLVDSRSTNVDTLSYWKKLDMISKHRKQIKEDNENKT